MPVSPLGPVEPDEKPLPPPPEPAGPAGPAGPAAPAGPVSPLSPFCAIRSYIFEFIIEGSAILSRLLSESVIYRVPLLIEIPLG